MDTNNQNPISPDQPTTQTVPPPPVTTALPQTPLPATPANPTPQPSVTVPPFSSQSPPPSIPEALIEPQPHLQTVRSSKGPLIFVISMLLLAGIIIGYLFLSKIPLLPLKTPSTKPNANVIPTNAPIVEQDEIATITVEDVEADFVDVDTDLNQL